MREIPEQYRQWIDTHYPTYESAYGYCAEATLRMQETFPELIRVRGHYQCWQWGDRDHWWLKTPTGEIIDPTAVQFPTQGRCEYREWVEGTPEPTGRCPNCGGLCYTGETCCSDRCGNAYAAYLMNDIRMYRKYRR